MVDLFHFFTSQTTDLLFPEQQIKIRDNDKPYFTEELRKLKRLRCREYNKKGKTDKYKSLVRQFDELLKCEIDKYSKKLMNQFHNGKRGSIYPLLRRIANGPNDIKNKLFHLPSHLENNFSPLQCAEDIAYHFFLLLAMNIT